MLLAVILALSFAAGALLAWVAMTPAVETNIARRLREVRGYGPEVAVAEELTLPFTQRVLAPLWAGLLRRLAAALPQALVESARVRLSQAGLTADPVRYVGMQAGAATLGAVTGLLLTVPRLLAGDLTLPSLLALLLALAGWRVPNVLLLRRIAARRTALARALPDVLDLLSVSVEAGLGFDGAVQKVAEKFPEPVAGEFRDYLKEVRVGRPRAEALRALAERSAVPDLKTFAAAVIQAEQLGVSMAKVLKAQSDALRTRRKQRAEERAMQLPLKMLFPLIFFIFPTLFIVILGPVLLQLLRFFGNS